MTILLPPAGQRLHLTTVDFDTKATAIVHDDRAADELLVREPLATGGRPVAAPPAGTALLLSWTTPAGRHELDATLVEVRRDHVPVWRLAATGTTRTSQLRRYARAADSLHGEITRGRDRWPAAIVDLSEGGARTLLPQMTGLHADDSVLLYVTVEEQRLQLPGRVLPFVPAQVGRTEVRLEFGPLGREADLLRRRVFELQVRARAQRRREESA
jgi:hypothetical protein